MNPGTEQEKTSSEFSAEFIQVLIAATGATLLLVFTFERIFNRGGFLEGYFFTPFPWITAAGQTIAEGLSQFSGNQPGFVPVGEQFAVLGNFLLMYVIAPAMFFFGWRHRRMLKEQDQKPSLSVWTLMFILGGILTFSAVIPAVPAAIAQRSVASRLHAAQAVQWNKDYMINDLNTIAWNARQYKILPKSMLGGNGSYIGFSLREEIGVTDNGTYTIEPSEKTCLVKAQSKIYSNAAITVTVNENGQLRDWRYVGEFE
ncbi:MAG: hypothetical protein HY562_02190 [Ignavibacteriales bacterium]|nr:hypothetical protein [Ignavibacteriales bacterium]